MREKKARWGRRGQRKARPYSTRRGSSWPQYESRRIRTIDTTREFGVGPDGNPGWHDAIVSVNRRLEDGRVASLVPQLYGLLVTVSRRSEWPYSWTWGWQFEAAASRDAVEAFESVGDPGYGPLGYAKRWGAFDERGSPTAI